MSAKANDINNAIRIGERLRVLELRYPKFDLSIYGDEFQKFVNIEELFIQVDVNYKYKLPQVIGELESLKKLHILNYPFKAFPNWVFKLRNLRNLMFRGNDIQNIPTQISELINLKHLRLENTKLLSISDCLLSLGNLESLSLVDNFELKDISSIKLPSGLKMIALTPSTITKEQIENLKTKNKKLEFGKRYFK